MKYIFFLFFLLLLQSPFQGWASESKPTDEERKKIAKQMENLSQILGGMPTPPKMDQTIMLPDPRQGETISSSTNSKKE